MNCKAREQRGSGDRRAKGNGTDVWHAAENPLLHMITRFLKDNTQIIKNLKPVRQKRKLVVLGMVVPTCSPSTQKDDAGESQVK